MYLLCIFECRIDVIIYLLRADKSQCKIWLFLILSSFFCWLGHETVVFMHSGQENVVGWRLTGDAISLHKQNEYQIINGCLLSEFESELISPPSLPICPSPPDWNCVKAGKSKSSVRALCWCEDAAAYYHFWKAIFVPDSFHSQHSQTMLTANPQNAINIIRTLSFGRA